ncbi:MAG TPA: glycosyltransferase, partial [Terriglobales bacterium]
MSVDAPRISSPQSLAVLIPTLNRPGDLETAVRTLLAQTLLPQELIIIDQSRTDDSERRVRALFEQHPECAALVDLRYTRDPAIDSLAKARNIALDQNRSDIFLFLDDDVELETDFIQQLMQGYWNDADVAGISGIITNYRPGGFASRLWQKTFVRGPFRDDRQKLYFRADELRGGSRIPVDRFGGGLMSFRTAAVGGLRFDPNLRGASEGEDVDFCLHMPKGSRLEIDPNARLVHKASMSARSDEHWIAAVVRGNTYLYHRNWQSGVFNRLAFAWLICGFALLAGLACAKRKSLGPWREFSNAMR